MRRKSSEKISVSTSENSSGAPVGSSVGALGLDVEELLAVVPLVKGLGLVEALVALEADQLTAGRAGDRLGELGLADPCGTLYQDRLTQLLGEVGDQRRGLVGEVARRLQGGLRLGHGAHRREG